MLLLFFRQAQAFTATGVTVAVPTLGSPALTPKSVLAANNLTVAIPILGAPIFTTAPRVLSAVGLTVAVPSFGTPILTRSGTIAAVGLTTAVPGLGTPGINELVTHNEFYADNLAVAVPILGIPELGENEISFPEEAFPPPPPLPDPRGRTISGDRHMRHGAADYAAALAALLPTGLAWPRWPKSVLMTTVGGLAKIWGEKVDSRAADLLERETDPRFTLEMLEDWERNWGLPDKCFFYDGGDIGGRRKTLLRKMTIEGAQSREFFVSVAADLGYQIKIREFSPFMCGVSRCGSTLDEYGDPRWEIGPPEIRFYWTVSIGDISLTWFRVTEGQVGVDPHLRIGYPTDLECLLNRWKPAHTYIVFDYSGVEATTNPLAGTP